jgi:hypothetical protein
MGFFSDVDIDIIDMIAEGATRDEVLAKYSFLTERELDKYFGQEYDYSIETTDDDVISYDDLVSEPEWSGDEEY